MAIAQYDVAKKAADDLMMIGVERRKIKFVEVVKWIKGDDVYSFTKW